MHKLYRPAEFVSISFPSTLVLSQKQKFAPKKRSKRFHISIKTVKYNVNFPIHSGKEVVLEQSRATSFLRGQTMQNEPSEKAIDAILIEIKRLENMICDLMNVSSSVASMDLYLDNAAKKFSLSDREFDVLKLIADGRSNNEISEQIQISVSTVKKHIYNIFNKAGVNSRTQLLNLIYGKN